MSKNYDLQNNIKDKRKNIFLLKNNNLFENIVFVKKFSHMDKHQDPIGYINEEDNYSINRHTKTYSKIQTIIIFKLFRKRSIFI